MRQKNPKRLVPSIIAASSSSAGMARRNGTRMMIVVGSANAICGIATPASVPSSPRFLSITKSGTIATESGNSRPAVNSEKIASRPRNS